jgi:hypothetical protein
MRWHFLAFFDGLLLECIRNHFVIAANIYCTYRLHSTRGRIPYSISMAQRGKEGGANIWHIREGETEKVQISSTAVASHPRRPSAPAAAAPALLLLAAFASLPGPSGLRTRRRRRRGKSGPRGIARSSRSSAMFVAACKAYKSISSRSSRDGGRH